MLPLELKCLGLRGLGAGLLDFELEVDLEIGVRLLQGQELCGLFREPLLLLCLLGIAGLCLRDELLLHLCGLDRKAP